MAKATKFGTFSGVFTPSILTILGVIMYLRLGWVVGEGGLIMTIGIIILAHVISLSTGLSISSIATDKKIKTGGIYYILSRSLGLPMGGAIGIAIFVGTALSISLYVVGFTESFLSIVPSVVTFLGIEDPTNQLRVIGSIILCILVILAFISTSLVIKTQFFILGAIFLSIVSIVVGFLLNGNNTTGEFIMTAASNETSFELLFGVFFPAATGFTAGVAMSGDLSDPKKSIPMGTMLSIIVGLVVYILLSIGLAFFVDRNMLINDNNFMMKIAWFSPFVVMGIWGATLSSALGGILGGPRILQAISNDKIMPAFLGKGYGASNEPRTALLVIFVIAEIGILIGELNVIAGVVSMFYLASYGFINLAFSLESWASTDFRPSFKVNPWIGFIGFFASFAVMFKLDTVSMFAALIIMTLIFLALKRKEFSSETGDVWQSVWVSIVRRALHRIEKNPMEKRNWQPNIILFSGGSSRRPYLVEFGETLVGKFGMLSNFDLVESKSSELMFTKHKQTIQPLKLKTNNDTGIFYRRQTCKDIYQGIEVIAGTYGFSGIEPNTILMGWARQSKNPEKFGKLIKNIYKLDLNILLMDYDQRFGFGDKKSIDIWWRDKGDRNNLSLSLAKFMLSSNEWESAVIRLLIITEYNQDNDRYYKEANFVLDNMRMSAEVKVFNNQIDNRHIYDIIAEESRDTSIVFLDIPDIEKSNADEFVQNTNKLLGDIGTVVLVKASSYFIHQNYNAEAKKKHLPEYFDVDTFEEDEKVVSPLEKYNLKIGFQENLKTFFVKLKIISSKLKSEYINNFLSSLNELIEKYINTQTQNIKELSQIDEHDYTKSARITENIFEQSDVFFTRVKEFIISNLAEQRIVVQDYGDKLLEAIEEMPDNLYIKYEDEELQSDEKDNKQIKQYKRKLRLEKKIKGASVQNAVKLKKVLRRNVPLSTQQAIFNFIEAWNYKLYESVSMLNKSLQNVQYIVPTKSDKKESYLTACKLKQSDYEQTVEALSKLLDIKNVLVKEQIKLKNGFDYYIEDNVSRLFDNININQFVNQSSKLKTQLKTLNDNVEQLPEKWSVIYEHFFNEIKLDNVLKRSNIRLFQILQGFYNNISKVSQTYSYPKLNKLELDIKKVIKKAENADLKIADMFSETENVSMEELKVLDKKNERYVHIINNLINSSPEKLALFDNIVFADLKPDEIEDYKTFTIEIIRLLDRIVSNDIKSLFSENIQNLKQKIFETDIEIITQNRLIRYSASKDKEDDNLVDDNKEKINLNEFLNERLEITVKLRQELEKEESKLFASFMNGYFKVNEKLQLYAFKKEANNSRNLYLPANTAKTGISTVKKKWNSVNEFVDRQLNEFWYRQSDAILLAEDLSTHQDKSNMGISVYKVLNTIQKASISNKTVSELPFYYKHLFLDKDDFNNEFWRGRDKEIERAKNAYERFKDEFKGALLVMGKRNSGKSFFIHHVCSQEFEDSETIFINAPDTNACFKKQMLKSLQRQTNRKGNLDDIFSSFEKGSIIVFEDIELWWEKSESGNESLLSLLQIIEKYSDRLFFIMSINSYSYNIIKQMTNIEAILLDLIECKPMNTRVLQDIVLFRHNASGLKFRLNQSHSIGSKKNEEDFKTKHFASLFSKYFNYSQGNVGTCLSAWMANIQSVEKGRIIMSLPSPINTSEFEKFDNTYLIILYQFIIHKSMDTQKFSRVMMISTAEAQQKLDFLMRAGVLTKKNNTYSITVYIQNAIIQLLRNKNIL